MQPKVILGKILYEMIGRHMPLSDSRINFGSKKVRQFCGRLILRECGKNVNIEKFAEKIKILQLIKYVQIQLKKMTKKINVMMIQNVI